MYLGNQFNVLFSVNACQPTLENDKATFRLNLQDIYQCMVTKVVNKETVCFFPNECPGLCQHRPGHSLGKLSLPILII